jgi:CubicO group peptidase (beta-lactamase class C family)
MRMRLPLALMLVLAGGCGRGARSGRWQAPPPESSAAPAAAAFDQVIETYRARGQFNGTVLIEKDGRVLYQKSAQLGQVPAGDAATRFRIGSVTKQFTAAAILKLEEEGKLDVDDSLATYWPDFPHGDRLTLHMLLSHTSGLDDRWMSTDAFDRIVESGGSLEQVVELIRTTVTPVAPGTRHRYANANYMLLGGLIETLAGQSYESFLAERLLVPAGLPEVGVSTTTGPVPGGVEGYGWDERGDQLLVPSSVQYGVAYSSGAVYASPSELCKWDRVLGSDLVLSAASRVRMETPVLGNYAYGWGVYDYGGHRGVEHGGAIEGFRTFFVRLVDDGVCIVVAANVEPSPEDAIAAALAEAYLGLPSRLPPEPVTLSAQQLERLTGRYRDTSGHLIEVTQEGDTLRLSHGDDLRGIKLIFEAPDAAFFRQLGGSVRFKGDGRASSLEVALYGDVFSAERE